MNLGDGEGWGGVWEGHFYTDGPFKESLKNLTLYPSLSSGAFQIEIWVLVDYLKYQLKLKFTSYLNLGGYHYLTFSACFWCTGVWDVEFLEVCLYSSLGRLYTKDIFKDQWLSLMSTIVVSPLAFFLPALICLLSWNHIFFFSLPLHGEGRNSIISMLWLKSNKKMQTPIKYLFIIKCTYVYTSWAIFRQRFFSGV